MKTFYITTAIDYPNARPHMGHAFEKIITDTLARWKRIAGYDTYFLTGTDENTQQMQSAASAAGKDTKLYVDKNSLVFEQFCKTLNVSNNSFIRTSEPHHHNVAQAIFKKVYETGDIYKGHYEGHFCTSCNTYLTEKDLIDGELCPDHNIPVNVLREEAYFFKMGKYKQKLLDYMKKNSDFIIPKSRSNEILSRLQDDVRDLCVSRSTMEWGIPVPIDKQHVIYVWFDALINYVSGIDYPHKTFKKYWPADVHVIGKDIIWFHTVIWPTMLLAADIELPKKVYAHGFINDSDGQKMSKTKGNVIDPIAIIDQYGNEVLKYYLLRTVPAGDDGNFSTPEMMQRYNSEFVNELGNLVRRAAVLTQKYCENTIPIEKPDKIFDCKKVLIELNKYMDNFEFNKALEKIFFLLHEVNRYVSDKAPWANEKGRKTVIYTIIDAIRLINILLQAFLPESSAKVRGQFNFDKETLTGFSWGLTKSSKIEDKGILFPKIEEEETFPLQLKVGKIVSIHAHPNADSLYLLKVDIGKEIQLVAGLKKYYSEKDLINKNIVVVTNLKHAKLRGVVSEGMLLAAEDDNVVKMLNCDDKPGSEIIAGALKNNPKQIKIDEFAKIKLTIKDGKVFYNDLLLKTSKCSITVTGLDEKRARIR